VAEIVASGSGEAEIAASRSGEEEPVAWGSGEAEPACLGGGWSCSRALDYSDESMLMTISSSSSDSIGPRQSCIKRCSPFHCQSIKTVKWTSVCKNGETYSPSLFFKDGHSMIPTVLD